MHRLCPSWVLSPSLAEGWTDGLWDRWTLRSSSVPWPGTGVELLCTEAQVLQVLCYRLPAGCSSSSRGAQCKQHTAFGHPLSNVYPPPTPACDAPGMLLYKYTEVHPQLPPCQKANAIFSHHHLAEPRGHGSPIISGFLTPQAPLSFSECLRAPTLHAGSSPAPPPRC